MFPKQLFFEIKVRNYILKGMLNLNLDDSEFLSRVERLFVEFCELGLPPSPDNTPFTEPLSILTNKKGSLSLKALLELGVHYTQDPTWQRRVFGLFLLMFVIKQDSSLRSASSRGSDRKMILTRYWALVTDPDPRVRKYVDDSDPALTSFVIAWTWYPETVVTELPPTYAALEAGEIQITLPLTDAQRQRIDLEHYTQSFPPHDASHQAAYFWRVITLLVDRMGRGEAAEIIPEFQQLIEASFLNTSYRIEQTGLEQEFPPVWAAIFSEYDYAEVMYLFLVLWGAEPAVGVYPLLVHLFLDYYPKWEVDAQSFDDVLGVPLARVVVELQDRVALGKLMGHYPYDPYGMDFEPVGAAYNRLFALADTAGWEEGTHDLLLVLIEDITYIYKHETDDPRRRWAFGRQLLTEIFATNLKAYLKRGLQVSSDLIEALIKFYPASLEKLEEENDFEWNIYDEIFSYQDWPPTADLYPQLVQIGHHIAQHKDIAARNECLTTQCLPLMEGMLEHTLLTQDATWTVEILSAMVHHYAQLGEPRLGFMVLPRDELREHFKLVFQQENTLQSLKSLLLQKIGTVVFWQEILERLYTQHGIELLRLFGALLGHMLRDSDN